MGFPRLLSSREGWRVEPRAPFRFDLALAYLRRSELELVEVVEADIYRRGVRLAGRPRVLEVRSEGEVDRPQLVVEVLGGGGSGDPVEQEEAVALVQRCFRTEEELAPLLERAEVEPVFGGLVERLRGLRALVMASAFEALVWAIIGQQINIAFAYRLKRVLVERYGERVEHDGRVYYLFPSPERLAALEPAELRPLQFSGQKARYIVDLARQIASGGLDLEALGQLEAGEARARLVGLRGVGRWTAEYVMMRGLGFRDELPAADIGLQNAAGQLYGLARRPTEPELRALAEPWCGWRSYYAFYQWFTLNPNFRQQ